MEKTHNFSYSKADPSSMCGAGQREGSDQWRRCWRLGVHGVQDRTVLWWCMGVVYGCVNPVQECGGRSKGHGLVPLIFFIRKERKHFLKVRWHGS